MADLPEKVYTSMKAATAAWNKLVALGPKNRATLNDLQLETFTQLTEIMRSHHSAINALIDVEENR